MKIALVHEWFTSIAGSELVVSEILKVYPQADIFAMVDFLNDKERQAIQGKKVNTAFIQKLPFVRKRYRQYLPLMPIAVEQFDLSEYDLILSSNHAVAKGVIRGPDQLHISYVHTPVRYAWDLQHQYLRESGLDRGLKGIVTRSILHYIRQWDRGSAERVDEYLANSRYVARRIRKFYGRSSEVIHPPVDVERFGLRKNKEDFYFTASRMVPYKRIDLIVEAFSQTPDRELVVIGDGPDLKKIKAKAGANVRVMGYQPQNVLVDHMQRAKGFVFAAEEDFGIIPVEAQACGTPVIAFGKGGALETVVDGRTGVFFHSQTVDSINEAIDRFEQLDTTFNPIEIRRHAEQFRPERFQEQFRNFVETKLRDFENSRSD